MPIIFISSLFLLLSSCTNLFVDSKLNNLSASQIACQGFKKQNRESIFWTQRFPIKIYVTDRFPEEKIISLQKAIYIWNESVSHNIFNIDVSKISNSSEPQKDNKNLIYWKTDWYSDDTRNATTLMYAESNNIKEADILLNAKNYVFSAGSPSQYETDLTSVLIHELGHVLGLDHSNSEDSVMQPLLSDGEERLTISSSDIANVQCMYF